MKDPFRQAAFLGTSFSPFRLIAILLSYNISAKEIIHLAIAVKILWGPSLDLLSADKDLVGDGVKEIIQLWFLQLRHMELYVELCLGHGVDPRNSRNADHSSKCDWNHASEIWVRFFGVLGLLDQKDRGYNREANVADHRVSDKVDIEKGSYRVVEEDARLNLENSKIFVSLVNWNDLKLEGDLSDDKSHEYRWTDKPTVLLIFDAQEKLEGQYQDLDGKNDRVGGCHWGVIFVGHLSPVKN